MSKHVERGPQGLFLLAKRSLAPVIWMPLLSFATLGVVLALTSYAVSADQPLLPPLAKATTTQPAPHSPARATVTQPTPQPPTSPTTPTVPQTAPAITVAAPAPFCTVVPFGTPNAIAPASAAPGVTEVTNPPIYYTFRGSTTKAATVAYAAACAHKQPALGGAYHGLTSHTISYAYDVSWLNNITCQVTNVRVTLHQSILLPQADMTGMPHAAAAEWQATVARLQAHEYEHVAINRQHARSLHDQLASLNGACETLNAQASATAARIIAAMNTANNSLDAHTNHGRQ